MIQKLNFFSRGQSLFEVIIAVSIAALVALGLVRLTTSSIKNSRFSKDQSLAESLAKKKFAEVVADKNNNSTSFWNKVDNCLPPLECKYSDDEIGAEHCISTLLIPVGLPTETPNLDTSQMVQIRVNIFFNPKGADTSCKSTNYDHQLSFDTYVTN